MGVEWTKYKRISKENLRGVIADAYMADPESWTPLQPFGLHQKNGASGRGALAHSERSGLMHHTRTEADIELGRAVMSATEGRIGWVWPVLKLLTMLADEVWGPGEERIETEDDDVQ